MKILIVEDEEKLVQSLQKALQREGYAVDYLVDGETALQRILVNHMDYDLIVLDLMLPKVSGTEICTKMRERGITTPVLVLTARGDEQDKIKTLDIGADDYLTKPFSLRELFARVRALLRRPNRTQAPKLSVRNIELDPAKHRVYLDGKEVNLTLKEYALLQHLMQHPDQVLNRDQILDHVWEFDYYGFSNVIDVHVKNLRKKIKDPNGNTIETVRGVGYRLNTR